MEVVVSTLLELIALGSPALHPDDSCGVVCGTDREDSVLLAQGSCWDGAERDSRHHGEGGSRARDGSQLARDSLRQFQATLVAWNGLKAEAEPSPSDTDGVEWSLRTRQPPVASALTSLVQERADVQELDSSQLLLHSSKESRETADRGSTLLQQLPAGHRPLQAVPSHDQLSFDFQ
eukprot:2558114-Rhodomonas_salina.1